MLSQSEAEFFIFIFIHLFNKILSLKKRGPSGVFTKPPRHSPSFPCPFRSPICPWVRLMIRGTHRTEGRGPCIRLRSTTESLLVESLMIYTRSVSDSFSPLSPLSPSVNVRRRPRVCTWTWIRHSSQLPDVVFPFSIFTLKIESGDHKT